MGKTKLKPQIIKETKTTFINSDSEVNKLVKIVLAVIILFGIFYLITVLVTKKDNKKEETPTTIQYDEIVLGVLLKQIPNEYYVLAYKEEDVYSEIYKDYLKSYAVEDKALRTYTVNLNSGFNSMYLSNEENLKVTNIDELKVANTTLFRIRNGKIVSTYSDKEELLKLFAELTKTDSK